MSGGEGGGRSLANCLSHLTIDHASLSRQGTVSIDLRNTRALRLRCVGGRRCSRISLNVLERSACRGESVVFGEFVGVKGYSGRQEQDLIGLGQSLEENLTVCSIRLVGWRVAAQKNSGWFLTVGDGA